jgi:hypothetical protein
MAQNDSTKLKNAALREELEAICRANNLFWQRGAEATFEERYDYHMRQLQLDKIRAELAQLPSKHAA